MSISPTSRKLLHASLETGGIGDIQLTETGSGPGCGPGPELGVDVAEDHLIALPGESLYNSPFRFRGRRL